MVAGRARFLLETLLTSSATTYDFSFRPALLGTCAALRLGFDPFSTNMRLGFDPLSANISGGIFVRALGGVSGRTRYFPRSTSLMLYFADKLGIWQRVQLLDNLDTNTLLFNMLSTRTVPLFPLFPPTCCHAPAIYARTHFFNVSHVFAVLSAGITSQYLCEYRHPFLLQTPMTTMSRHVPGLPTLISLYRRLDT
jgi:hypothetical protein